MAGWFCVILVDFFVFWVYTGNIVK
jgi:hypothetical protein